jgi:hypothetical protein
MAGITVPLQPVKHQYIITEKIAGLSTDAPTIRDPDRRTYFKEEVGGLVMGGYEPNPQPWDLGPFGGNVPDDWEFRLFDDDYDHFEQHMTQAIARVPALETVGVKQMINGPESFTPDGNFILGAAPECANMFVGAGFNAFGIASGGGAGWMLAQWAIDGEAPLDLWVVDIRRFSGLHRDRAMGPRPHAAKPMASTTRPASRTRNMTAAGRPSSRRSTTASRRTARSSVRSSAGSGPTGFRAEPGARDVYSMGRQNWFGPVGEEHSPCPRACRPVRPVVLREIRGLGCGCAARRSTGSAPTTWRSRSAASPTRSFSTGAAASRPT